MTQYDDTPNIINSQQGVVVTAQECHCVCHSSDRTNHIVHIELCCLPCPKCHKNIIAPINTHLKECKGL